MRSSTGIPIPDAAHIAAIRAPASENAAAWLHLIAATLAVVVVAPRVLLALVAGLVERYRAAHLCEDFADPYFQRLLRGFQSGPATVEAVPYSYALPASAAASLQQLFARALGGTVTVTISPAVAYGDEDTMPNVSAASIVAAVFNAVATPEREAHGRFLATLAQSGRQLVVVVDESALDTRWAEDSARRDARRDLWRELAADAGRAAVFVDLAQPDVDMAEAAFAAALDKP